MAPRVTFYSLRRKLCHQIDPTGNQFTIVVQSLYKPHPVMITRSPSNHLVNTITFCHVSTCMQIISSA